MKFLVVGTGSIGLRHIDNLRINSVDVDFYSYQKNQKNNLDFKGDNLFSPYELVRYDAVVIANETSKHLDVAAKCLESNTPFYIEKPISNNMIGVLELNDKIKDKKLITKVGYMLRAHPNLVFIKQYLELLAGASLLYVDMFVGQWIGDWRPKSDYKLSYSASIARGGGVIFDLIHELDVANWLFGPMEKVFCYKHNAPYVGIETESLAEIILLTSSQIPVRIHMDYLFPTYKREMIMVFGGFSIIWNYVSGTVIREEASGTRNILHQLDPGFSRNQMFLDFMREFIEDINSNFYQNTCNFSDGLKTLDIACKAHKSGEEGVWMQI